VVGMMVLYNIEVDQYIASGFHHIIGRSQRSRPGNPRISPSRFNHEFNHRKIIGSIIII